MTSEERTSARGRVLRAEELKALAHPLRVQLLELLADEGPATASGLGRAVGQTSGTTSYHLRRLAEVGLVEEAPELGNARDRFWRRGTGWTIEADLRDDTETRGAARVIIDEVLQANIERLKAWHRDAHRWPSEWRESSLDATSRLHLAPEQARQLGERILEVIDDYRPEDPAAEPEGADARRVVVYTSIFPTGAPPE